MFYYLFWLQLAKNERQSGKTDPARARKLLEKIAGEGLKGPPLMGKGRRPHVYEGRARARARARALSTRKFQNSRFLLDNSQNNQGKSCSAPRVWQLCKSSAQSEPISNSYDQNKFIKVFF